MFKTVVLAGARVRPVRLIVILLVGQGMASMDSSILAVASPALRANLHASDPQLQLVLVMYTVVFAALVIIGARLGDVLGRRRLFLAGLAGFTLASLAGGLAPTPVALIVARGVQGAGGALMTPQVLSTIQLRFDGRTRARAIGAYSMVLAVGVAAGQIAGGLIVGAHLLDAAWRPALLLNVPVGIVLLLAAWRWMPALPRGRTTRLDYGGATLLGIALASLVLPLTLGREERWPMWVWPCLATCAIALTVFIALERHITRRGGQPLFDVSLMRAPGVAAGSLCVLLVMGCYAGFLISLTLYLQNTLRFSPLHAGLTFALYACGFAIASLTWTRASVAAQLRLPVLGPLAMGASVLTIGWITRREVWPVAATTALLGCAGAGHACGFSPLTSRMVAMVRPFQAADLSGLVITASLTGQILGVAGFAGVYLSAAANGSANPLAITTDALAATLLVTGICASRALTGPSVAEPTVRGRPNPAFPSRWSFSPAAVRPWRKSRAPEPINRGWTTTTRRSRMTLYTTGTYEEHLAARIELLEAEKELSRQGDELARRRRALPRVPVEQDYLFDTLEGEKTLRELFAGRSQLLVYHFMFGPNWTEGCPLCSYWADSFDTTIVHLHHRDVTMVCASRAPVEQLDAYKRRMGWSFPWVSSGRSDFNYDFGVSVRGLDAGNSHTEMERPTGKQAEYNFTKQPFAAELPGLSAFALDREEDVVYHTYSCYARGLDAFNSANQLLDRAPHGRDEDALPVPFAWIRRHDEYEPADAATASA